MRIPHDTAVLVADGRKMLFFRNEGDADYPSLTVIRHREHQNPPDRDQKSDASGQRPSSATPGGESAEEVDFHVLEEDRFAAEAAEMLKVRAVAGEYAKLLVVAPPKTLGELRKHYHKEVESRLLGEMPKDLTGHPVDQIERIIAEG
ncbi:MAG: host attachment protein [Sphingomonadaceae bacterium]|nr:host attachment protein [Sphingomonadaceae bacterium]